MRAVFTIISRRKKILGVRIHALNEDQAVSCLPALLFAEVLPLTITDEVNRCLAVQRSSGLFVLTP